MNKCPLGGSVENDCEGCAYSGNFHYDEKTGDCIRREEGGSGLEPFLNW